MPNISNVKDKCKLYVIDRASKRIVHIEESYSSLVWTERYQEAGEFVLEIPLDAVNFKMYRRGNYLKFDDSKETMLIESLNVNDEVEDPVLEISGRSLSSLLERRVNASKFAELVESAIVYEGAYGEIVSSIIDDDIINPVLPVYYWRHKNADGTFEDGYDYEHPSSNFKDYRMEAAGYRTIDAFSYRNLVSQVSVKKTYSSIVTIYEILTALSKRYVTGFRVLFENGNFVLETYKGTDRTSKQKVLSPVIFNPIMDNISYVNYFEDQTKFKNIAFSYTDGPWSPVDENASFSNEIYNGYSWVPYKDEYTDISFLNLNRYELPVDARSSASAKDYEISYSSESSDETGDGAGYASIEKLESAVESVAEEEFDTGDHDFIKTSEGSIDPLVRYTFEVDYFLGDMVEISNSYGVVMTALIDEVVKSYDSDGYTVTPNFKNMEDYDYGEDDDTGEEETT